MSRKVKFVIAFWLLMLGGLVLTTRASSGDNVVHRTAVCRYMHWSTTQARYIITNVTKGGGCK